MVNKVFTEALEDRERYAAGMAIQLARLRDAIDAGMPRRGWKIGINVPEILEAQGLSHPGVGWIRGDRVLESGAMFEPPAGARLHVEAEICLRMSGMPPPGCGREEAFAAIASVAPALEIVNYARSADGLDDVIADSMFHEACVIGAGVAASTVPSGLGNEWPVLSVDTEPGPPARPDLVSSHLGDIATFVASFLETFGQSLRAGDLILSGSYMARASRVRPGQSARARFGSLGEVFVRIGD